MPVIEESIFIARPPQDGFGRLADPFIEKAQSRTVRANLETLAELLVDHQGK